MAQGDEKRPSGLSETQGRLSALFKGAVEGRNEKAQLSLTDSRTYDLPKFVEMRGELKDLLDERQPETPAPVLRPSGPGTTAVLTAAAAERDRRITELIGTLSAHDLANQNPPTIPIEMSPPKDRDKDRDL